MVKSQNLHLFELDNLESDVELYLPETSIDESFELELPDPIEPLIENIKEAVENSKKEEPLQKCRTGTVVKLNCQPRAGTTRRVSDNIESRMESALASLIEQRIQTKALPLALRKRLMYERACSS